MNLAGIEKRRAGRRSGRTREQTGQTSPHCGRCATPGHRPLALDHRASKRPNTWSAAVAHHDSKTKPLMLLQTPIWERRVYDTCAGLLKPPDEKMVPLVPAPLICINYRVRI